MFDTYGVCPCGYKERAPFGTLFHIHRTVCPKCGVNIEGNWRVKTLRKVSMSVLLKPSTWGKYKWEERPNPDYQGKGEG
jgi:hypothetical protein